MLNTGMQTCQAYQGCPTCTHSWSPGSLIPRKQCVYDGYRRFLCAGSRGRKKTFKYQGAWYQFRCVETRPKPTTRDDVFVRKAVSLGSEKKPFAGHKSAPLLARWPDFSWYRMNVVELMHGELHNLLYHNRNRSQSSTYCLFDTNTDIKNLCDNLVRLLVGKVNPGYSGWSKDAAHRRQCEKFDVFPDIWPANGGPLPWRLLHGSAKVNA